MKGKLQHPVYRELELGEKKKERENEGKVMRSATARVADYESSSVEHRESDTRTLTAVGHFIRQLRK